MTSKRKLLMFFGQLVCATVIILAGKMTGAEFADLEKAAMLYFAGANVFEHFAQQKKGGANA